MTWHPGGRVCLHKHSNVYDITRFIDLPHRVYLCDTCRGIRIEYPEES